MVSASVHKQINHSTLLAGSLAYKKLRNLTQLRAVCDSAYMCALEKESLLAIGTNSTSDPKFDQSFHPFHRTTRQKRKTRQGFI